MATNSNAREERPRSSRSTGGTALRKTMAAAISTDTLVDLIERLGLLDLVVDRLRARLEATDIDEILDDIGDYLKRNPEVVVVALGTITVMAGVLVYLERQETRGPSSAGSLDAEEPVQRRPRPVRSTPRRAAAEE